MTREANISSPKLRSVNEAIYCEYDGRARLVPSMALLDQYPELIATGIEVGDINLRWGPQIPLRFFPRELTKALMRQRICRHLEGDGIEFGAGPRPLEIPPYCRVRYADRFTAAEFTKQSSAAIGSHSRYVDIDLVDRIEDMASQCTRSIDFVIASHVIEHLSNPIKMFKTAYDRLRAKGKLVLVIPDMERTFDAGRAVTSLDHLLLDYNSPSRERDIDHYLEYEASVLRTAPDDQRIAAEKRWLNLDDIHLHTFTFQSFTILSSWICQNVGFSKVWSDPGRFAAEQTNEFYFVFTK